MINKFMFSSLAQSCPTLCDPMNCSTPGLPVHHQLPEFTQTHVHRVSDAIQPSHPLSPTSPSEEIQFSSVAQSCPTLCDPMNCSTPGLPVHHQLPESTQTHVHCVGDAINHLILCHSLLLLPSIFPSIRVFSNESTLRMRWPKY